MRHAGIVHRGFSLIEVVISILVLSLGLLGILAAFPSVIELQRRAQDDVLGAAAMGAAEAYIRSTIIENTQLIDTTGDNVYYTPAEMVFLDSTLSSIDLANDEWRQMTYQWEWEQTWPQRRINPAPNGGERGRIHGGNANASNLLNGVLTVGAGRDSVPTGGLYIDPSNPSNTIADPRIQPLNMSSPQITFDQRRQLDRFEIPVSARLFPQPGSGAEPQYVWDFVMRRVDIGLERGENGGNPAVNYLAVPDLPVQFAVFVRRIDPGIRVPDQIGQDSNFTLGEALSGYHYDTGTGSARSGDPIPRELVRLPVSAISQGGGFNVANFTYPTVPTLDGRPAEGTSGYSPILGISITVDPGNNGSLDVVEFSEPNSGSLADAALRLEAGKPLQILVDNGGGVRRVLEVIDSDNGGPTQVRVDPPFSITDSLAGAVEQAVFTPQIPVAVRVLEFRR